MAPAFSEDLTNDICERIANGESLRSICQPEGMPAASTVCLWLTKYEKFAERYAHARERQADYYADDIIEIADKATSATYNADRLRIDARKWKASKMAPKRYGDKLTHAGDENQPINHTFEWLAPSE